MKTHTQDIPINSKPPIIWALNDKRPGNNSQVLGVVKNLYLPFVVKYIDYNKLFFLRFVLKVNSKIGFSKGSISSCIPPWPDLVISAGRRAAHFACWIKKQSGGISKLVSIMFPGKAISQNFSLIALPNHDKIKDSSNTSNIVRISGAPNNISEELLHEQKIKFSYILNSLPKPWIAVLVGGSTKKYPFSIEFTNQFAQDLKFLSKSSLGSVLLATSRRTSKEMERALLHNIPNPKHISLWGDDNINHYLTYLALADVIIVTGDSITMCSEACASNKPVYIYLPPYLKDTKYEKFSLELFEAGYARPFIGKIEKWQSNKLCTEIILAKIIKNKLFSSDFVS